LGRKESSRVTNIEGRIMATVKRLCVYCGSSERVDEIYRSTATRLGKVLAEARIEIIYGGGRVGLMGLVADAALAAGGRVTGIIPDFLHDPERAHTGLSELIVVGSMHERKQRMFERADGFVILPGGLGTLDEAFEIITWKQLKLHDKPIVLVDTAGYWAPLDHLIDHIIAHGFVGTAARQFFQLVRRVEDVLPALANMPEPTAAKSKLV
jgi:uncharacterized protein (TIGR00730 family)